jgi:glyoxylase-like metal-dependent hydrolase (beta-lactamase superfamily II)
LQTGLWHWEASHPEWTPANTEGWGPDVSSYAIDDGERLLLIDPIAPPSEIDELAGRRDPVVVLTSPWHERDARSLVERLEAPVFLPRPDEFNDDVAWLRGDLEHLEKAGRVYSAGDRLPIGIEAFTGRLPNDLVLWVESRRALIIGDTLVDFGDGLKLPTDWPRASRGSRHSRRCARCSSCRSSPCFQRTARQQIEPRSSARSPE